mmetsp:Transcript_837/g.757  ORF Transcript_837/g.757 Transcript_837/m.757 type:complete len:278 (-) Transcript_837:56-889(-)|eukprot:CAMPEP_0197838734 /NCGR_PEP_ID=MMETSP1437-20131217/38370_1 /TAXON_ID=49252 ORGANISM="Eucampia antarctica, Strain CCMP1452" /NCGR_SAMPLE_ID=MMETSP1437 /ASSEMBLY_ACC=CAM_ASM_001096 /LENGTH=277 /DNA_ID=CAMNT_0043447009 /DNA_START=89 /DNA_END=922 /DNA_ORIENTATION=-
MRVFLTIAACALLNPIATTFGFQSLIPKFDLPKLEFPSFGKNSNGGSGGGGGGDKMLEEELLVAIEKNGKDNRLNNNEEIDSIVTQLEENQSGIPEPAISSKVYGKWRLLHTTNADTSSPIQRKAVDTTKFNIYQDIVVSEEDDKLLLVNQIVKFSDTAQLCVTALASTAAYPLEELSDREGTGKILGLNILGVSLIGEQAAEEPSRPNSRINFVFDQGNFDFNGLQIPYPVPFRIPLFRDAVKGWIDITYLSNNIRIARGNKGTTFILQKEESINS